jgi:hypothetical protein
MSADLAPLFAVATAERQARLREFRMASLLLCGPAHPVTAAFGAAVEDPDAIGEALAAVDCLPARTKRRLLGTLVHVLPAHARGRGGDPYHEQRAIRDEALRQIAAMARSAGVPAEQIARDLAARLARYQPAPAEAAPDRVLMREIVATGLPVPGPDRLRHILRSGPG